MPEKFYVTELDSKPISHGGWFPSIAVAVDAARTSVKTAAEATLVAVVGDMRVLHRVARADHPEVAAADEIVEVMR